MDEATRGRILRLHDVDGLPRGTIARLLGVHHSTVKRVLEREAPPAHRDEPTPVRRTRAIDVHVAFLRATLEQYPTITASRLFQMVRERGYQGGPDHFRHLVAEIRPRQRYEAFLRQRTLPGEEAQVDWGHFGRVRVGNAKRPLYAFVMVLSYSRAMFVRFTFDQGTASFLRCHQEAFAAFGGVPRRILYDNLKSAVIARQGSAIQFNDDLLRFAAEWRFEPVPVGVRRGNEKGRVERSIRYLRTSFWEARNSRMPNDLNEAVASWVNTVAHERPWPECKTETVAEALERDREKLLPLRGDRRPYEKRVEVKVAKWAFVMFDGNEYSVPHRLVRRRVTLRATDEEVRIFDGAEFVASHHRSFDRGEVVEDPAHQEELLALKRKGREGRTKHRLTSQVPATTQLLEALAARGDNIGSAVAGLSALLDTYGQSAFAHAVHQALERGSPHPHSVQHILDAQEREKAKAPAVKTRITREIPGAPEAIAPPDFGRYDRLALEAGGEIQEDETASENEASSGEDS